MTRVGVVGAELTESETALRVFLAAGGLILLGILFLVLTIWWWRSTKPESPALGPLEVMSERKWFTAAESERRRLLEQHRPDGAAVAYVAPEPVDLSVLAREAPSSFDDLRDPYEAPVAQALDPEAAELASTASATDAADAPDEAADAADEAGVPVDDADASETAAEVVVEEAGDLATVGAPDDGDAGSSNGAHHADQDGPDGQDGPDDQDGGDAATDDAAIADATLAMSRDATTAMPSPGRPTFVPHAGA